MTPLPPPAAGLNPGLQGAGTAALSCAPLVVMRNRADFLRAASALRQSAPGFLLQARSRSPADDALGKIDPQTARIGFTCSKKVGNAVVRNRAKRRLREIARLTLAPAARPGWDYVLIGRPGVTTTRDFASLQDDLGKALASVHRA